MYKIQILRSLVNDRLNAAVEEIFGVFERTIEEYEGEIDRQRQLLDALKPEIRTDSLPPELLVSDEEVHPEQHKRSPVLLQGLEKNDVIELTLYPESDSVRSQRGEKTQSSQLSQIQDPEFLQIKQEQEELFQDLEEDDGSEMTSHLLKYENNSDNSPSSQFSQTQDTELLQIKNVLIQGLEEADHAKITVHPVKCEDGQENVLLPFQPFQTQMERNREAYSLPGTSTEPDGDPHRVCPICGKDFAKNNDMVTHMRSHTGEKPFICNDCGKAFTHKGDLNRHMRTHTGEKPFSCSICGKTFSQAGTVKRHMETHLSEKLFSCPVCVKRFSRRGHLLNHMGIHTGERLLSCTICGKRFTHSGNLKAHMRLHTGERPYSCNVCGKSFPLLLYLKRHKCLTVSWSS